MSKSNSQNMGASGPAINERPTSTQLTNFSLVSGGPLFQFYLRSKLARPSLELVHRRILASALITWLPLLVFTVIAGNFMDGVKVAFLFDLDAHIRFLISLPLLVAAEVTVHRLIRPSVEQFLVRGLIAPEDRPRFDAILSSTMRLRNSVIIELVLLLVAFVVGYWVWRTRLTLNVATWYAIPVEGSMRLTWAGCWYAFVSLPIVRFMLFRWYFRLLLWYLLLWKVSHLPLRLNPLHPDRSGGLGFLSNAITFFGPILTAQSAFLAGLLGNRIWHEGAKLQSFKFEILGLVVFLLLLVLIPLGFFAFKMYKARILALHQFGKLASSYVNKFRQKWMQGDKTPDDELLGSGDIQSLADLANSYGVVGQMRTLALDKGTVLRLVFLIVLPLVPLVLTMVPLNEIVRRLMSILL